MIHGKHASQRLAALTLALLTGVLGGCAGNKQAAAPTASPEPTAQQERIERQAGERYEGSFTFQGVEETARYERIRSDTLGFEMDYDYEAFKRQSEADRERFISAWDDPARPVNYLEVTARAEDAETTAAAIGELLSDRYEVRTETVTLDRAGSCISVDATLAKGGKNTADEPRHLYVFPKANGCLVAETRYDVVESDYFGMRFRYFLNTFSLI